MNYLKVLSAKQGELSYDIQVYLESDQANPIFEENDKPMRFMEALTGSIAPHPIMGAKNSRIPFTYTIEKTNQWLDGKPLGVSASISNLKADQIKLYYVSDGQEKEIPLKSGGNDYVYCYTEEDFAIGTLSGGASYTFKVEVNVLIDNASISLVPKVKDIYHPAWICLCGPPNNGCPGRNPCDYDCLDELDSSGRSAYCYRDREKLVLQTGMQQGGLYASRYDSGGNGDKGVERDYTTRRTECGMYV